MATKKIGLVFGAGLVAVFLAYGILVPKHKTNPQTVAKQVLPPVDDNLAQAEKLPVSETELIAQQEAELDAIYFNSQLVANTDIGSSKDVLPVARQLPSKEKNSVDEEVLDSQSLLGASLLYGAPYKQITVPTRAYDKALASVAVEVMAVDGTLGVGFEYKEDCSNDPCTNNIIETATDKTVWNGTWLAGYLPTYNGKQVIKVSGGT